MHAAACAGARVLAANGVRPGDAVAVLAAKPFEVAPVAQAAWLAGASVTMLHQPTARTNLATYAEDTAAVLSLIGAKAAVLGDPFTDFVELLDGSGVQAFTVDQLLADPGGPAPEVEISEDHTGAAAAHLRLDLDPEGRADHPPQPVGEHRVDVRERAASSRAR